MQDISGGPSDETRAVWSIGLYSGLSPLHLFPAPGIRNPILTRDHVTDRRAGFVADPFLIHHDRNWFLFFEVKNDDSGKGEIGLATGPQLEQLRYHGIVLAEPFHLSYPYVFRAEGDWYMIPESAEAGYVRVYRAARFPLQWEPVADILEGRHADPSIVRWRQRWWLFTCDAPDEHDSLRLFHSATLLGGWREHPLSPLITGDNRSARPAGRFLVMDQCVIRYAQDCHPDYGTAVRAFEIKSLCEDDYQEDRSPHHPLGPAAASGWNSHGMHHVAAVWHESLGWIAAVDGSELKPE